MSSDFTWRRIRKEEEGKNSPYLLKLSRINLFTRIKTQLRETLKDELQKLQLENIELKLKYKAAKNEVKHYQERLNEVESEIKLQAIKESKCVLRVTYLSFSPL